MNTGIKLFVALAGCMAALPALAHDKTYDVQGTFADGGTFSGTFSYDPSTHSYTDAPNDLGKFVITIAGETSGVRNYTFTDFEASSAAAADVYSTPKQFVMETVFSGDPNTYLTLTLDWNNSLSGRGRNSDQVITGGDATYDICPRVGSDCTINESQVSGGSVSSASLGNGHGGHGIHAMGAPEVDPASALSALTLLGACLAFMRGRRGRAQLAGGDLDDTNRCGAHK